MEALQSVLISAASFIVVLSVVVFVHEFGHFQSARWLKVAIDTFSIGFGKTLLSWRDKQGVDWKIGALPLGGYVKFTGDADAVSSHSAEPLADDPQAKALARAKGLFHAQPIWVRAIVVAAGPLTNFVFAVLAFAVVGLVRGAVEETDFQHAPAFISEVAPGSAAEEAGIRAGEIVVAVDGVEIGGMPHFQRVIATSAGETLTLTLRDAAGAQRSVDATPRRAEGSNKGMLGVGLSIRPEDRVITEIRDPIAALGYGARQTWSILAGTLGYIGDIFSGRASGNDIAGPLGIFMQSGTVTQTALEVSEATQDHPAGTVALSLLMWAAMLSVAVGFVNLLPIPVLDGGHLALYAVEAARGGKPLPPMAQEWAFRAGLAVIACLFLFATWNDLSRTFFGAQG